ncbi:MAG: M23 family peptidase, partial [Sphingomonadales bacterium]|nr:M23 family peptidase [Sphingomonadales bacterium]
MPQDGHGDLRVGTGPLAQPIRAGAVAEGYGLAARLRILRDRLLDTLTGPDWAPDLAEDIGSARWFRGLGTLLGLSALAVATWPDHSAITAAPAMPIDAAARDEFRSQTIQPLALGSDTGRRMRATSAVVPLAGVAERSTQQLTATLGQGDSFSRMLERAGVGGGDAAQVERLVAGVISPSQIVPGTQVDITLGKQAQGNGLRPLDHLSFRARFDLDLSVVRGNGGLVLQQHPLRVDTTPLRIRGTVGSSIYLSARAAGAPIEAIQQYLQVID